MTTLSAAIAQPCMLYESMRSTPTEKAGTCATSAPHVGPKMKPRTAIVESRPVSSVRRLGGVAMEMYACSTACAPPEPTPCSKRETSTAQGAALAPARPWARSVHSTKIGPARAYAHDAHREREKHKKSARLVPMRFETVPMATEPIPWPTE
eukprot:scaffold9150_cov120-Isochrysis_galbana.AAC.17